QTGPRNGIAQYMAPRPRSAAIIVFLRSEPSTSAPAKGPNRRAGSVLATRTAPPAAAAAESDRWYRLVTRTTTAVNPTQSPSDETVIAARSLANGGCLSRSL